MDQLTITSFTADGAAGLLVTDSAPRFSFSYTGHMTSAAITVDGCTCDASAQTGVPCPQPVL